MNTLKNENPTIALLVGSLSSNFQENILQGAAEAAKKFNFNLICFAGGPIQSPDPLCLNREYLFDLVDLDIIDGLIIPISSHTRFLNDDEIQTFLNKFNSKPIINIGSIMDGYKNILSKYSIGIDQAVNHFANVHNFKQIAYINGPTNHKTSILKFESFKTSLKTYNLKMDKKLIFNADLNKESAKQIANKLIDDNGKFKCDAVLTTNDNQALGLIQGIEELGYVVPRDIAVCGSGNVPDGQFSNPTLTSIHEPNYNLGYASVENMSKIFKGNSDNKSINVETSLVIRESCGCNSLIIDREEINTYKTFGTIESNIIDEIRESSYKSLIKHNYHSQSKPLEDLLTEFSKALKNENNRFIEILNEQFINNIETEAIIPWIEISTIFQLAALNCIKNKKGFDHLLNFNIILTILKNNVESKSINIQLFHSQYYINSFREIANKLNTSFNLHAIKKYVSEILKSNQFHLSIYNYNDNNIKSVTNLITMKNNRVIEIPVIEGTFKKEKLFPPNIPPFTERFTLLVMPLSYRQSPLGYFIVNLSKQKGVYYENIQAIISTALKNELQIEELKKAEERFSDIAHSTSNWLWESDKNYKFIYSSDSVYDVLGYTSEEIIGKDMISLSLDNRDGYYKIIKSQAKINSIECRYKHKNNKTVCLRISANPIIKNNKFIGYRGVMEDITEKKEQDMKINNLAYTDILTGLFNRAMFQENLKNTIETSKLKNSKFALMFIDLDRFKYVNDSFGHPTGDLLLIKIAQLLKITTRSKDIIARLGGDEFIIILTDIVSEKQVINIAKRIIESIARPIIIKGKKLQITTSLGISIYPIDTTDPITLLKQSDSAMYHAKSLGRNRYAFYDNKLEEKTSKRAKNENILYSAINNNQFILNYQPQVDTFTGEVLGFEVLVRINNPIYGIIYPQDFIPLAEEMGVIGIIDKIVLIEACKQHKKWIQEGFGKIRISLNLSASELKNRSIATDYEKIFRDCSIDTKYIQFEITENSLIENEEIALNILQKFKASGVNIALDDFGTGYSSLSCISLYPIDTVKIDKVFVSSAVEDIKSRAIIDAICHLAKNLNLKIIAEGVESEEQLKLIKSLSCDEIQGFYFHKPYSTEDTYKLLKKSRSFSS